MKMPAEATCASWKMAAENALKTLVDIQSMIDIMSERLIALRDLRLQEFIKQEIRSLEGKLVKHFWRQLTTKLKIPKSHWLNAFQSYPSLSQWLTVVGLSKNVNEKLTAEICTIESLLELNGNSISKLLFENGGDSEDGRKLLAALRQLREFNEKNGNSYADTEGIYWDSWCKTPDNSDQYGDDSGADGSRKGISSKSDVDYNENIRKVREAHSKNSAYTASYMNNPARNKHEILVHTTSGRTTTPVLDDRAECDASNQISPPSPSHSSRSSLSSSGPPSPSPYGTKFISLTQTHLISGAPSIRANAASVLRSGQSTISNTPPPDAPCSDVAYESGSGSVTNTASGSHLLLPFGQMRNARSYEWQVGNHLTVLEDENMTNSNLSLISITTLPPPSSNLDFPGQKLFSGGKKRKKRPGDIVIQGKNPPDLIDLMRPGNRRPSQTMTTPSESVFPAGASGSPMSPRTPMTPATPVSSEMWLQHKDVSISPSVPQTPKTPSRLRGLRAIKDKIKDKIGIRSKLKRNKSEERVADEAVILQHHKVRSETFPLINTTGILQECSQNPSSSPIVAAESGHNSSYSSGSSSQFMRMHNESSSFDASLLSSGMATPGETSMLSGRDNFGFDMNSYFENSSYWTGTDKTVLPEGSDSVIEDTMKSQDHEWDTEDLTSPPSDVIDGDAEQNMRTNLMRQTSTMSSMHEEWDIPWDDLVLQERIGTGRVGSVYRGKWHGEVAIRVINICHNDEFKLHAFKNEVMLYKMTRHDNVELFMGSCMNPPHLAIITGFCRGKSLYHYIRANREQVNLNLAKIIAQHVAQGMGYLHSRGIIHKDLKSKNIFIDGKRVTVTDFGLMGLHAISTKSFVKPRTLQIPDGWLCYMAPEVIRALKVPQADIDVVSSLPYTKESDVYAFGTVWYELLTSCWPFKDYPVESIIWQVGNGKKQSLAHLQGAKELKDILMACWNFDHAQRPDFTDTGIMGQLIRLPQAKIIRRSSQPIKGNRKGGRPGAIPGHDRLFDPTFTSVLHELAE